MRKGDIVLVPFPFTDLTGSKYRPAVVLVANEKDVTLAFLTSQVKWKEVHDLELIPNDTNKLKTASLIRISKLATLDKLLVEGKLGALNTNEIQLLNEGLIALFKLA
jgi:mRNA interferase MazF